MVAAEQDVRGLRWVITSKSSFLSYFPGARLVLKLIDKPSTQDCFSHDLCSYWNDATGGASDDNCGAAYKAAMDDYLLGGVDGCTREFASFIVPKFSIFELVREQGY